MDQTTVLRSCPTCLASAELIKCPKEREYSAQCIVCKCRLPWCPTENGAVMSWNALYRVEELDIAERWRSKRSEKARGNEQYMIDEIIAEFRAVDSMPYDTGKAITNIRHKYGLSVVEAARAFGVRPIEWRTIERTYTLSDYRREQLGIKVADSVQHDAVV